MSDLVGRLVAINGAELYFEERGDGSSLILVNGGLGSSCQWAPVVPELADRWRFSAPSHDPDLIHRRQTKGSTHAR
jgi:pimeloyl-ACP methyl ester carboxylesterase